MPEPGQKIPAFELSDQTGKKITSGDIRGTKTVLYFYPKDFTPGCTTEAAEFSKEYPEFERLKIRIIGISPDDSDSHAKFCQKMEIPYTLLADEDGKMAKAFGVWGKKKFMGREYTGVIRSTVLVDESGKIIKIFKKVRPAGHAQEVLEIFQKGIGK